MKNIRLENFLSIFGREVRWAIIYELWLARRPLSVPDLMKRIGCSESVVRKHAHRLCALAVISRQFIGRIRGVEYSLNFQGEYGPLLAAVCKLFEVFPCKR